MISPKLISFVSMGVLIGGFIMAIAAVPTALADERAAAVEARQNAMKSVGKHMKALGGFVKGGVGTAEEAAAHAEALAGIAKKIPALFEVKATLEEMDAVGKNRGKPKIWADWADFETAAMRMGNEAMALAAVLRSGDGAAQDAQFDKFGKNGCGGCHEPFRGPEVK